MAVCKRFNGSVRVNVKTQEGCPLTGTSDGSRIPSVERFATLSFQSPSSGRTRRLARIGLHRTQQTGLDRFNPMLSLLPRVPGLRGALMRFCRSEGRAIGVQGIQTQMSWIRAEI